MISIPYLIFCALVGIFGRSTRMGFLGSFALSVLVTPLVVGLVLILTRPRRKVEILPPEPQAKEQA